MCKKRSKALTFDEVADEYDKIYSGRKARTLPMDSVLERIEKHEDFIVDEKEGTFHKILS